MKIRDLTFAAMFTALTAAMAQIYFYLPIAGVQFTLQTLAVFLCGAVLNKKSAVLSMTAYILLGTFGVPVFSKFMGGPAVLLGLTGGFVFSFPVMAFLIAFAAEKFGRKWYVPVMSMTVSLVVCYLFGAGWYSITANVSLVKSLLTVAVPFIPVDLLKIVPAVIVTVAVRKPLEKLM